MGLGFFSGMPRTLCASVSELLGGTCDFDGISPPPGLQADNLSRAMNSVPEDLRSAGAEADEGSKQVPRTTSHARACCLALTAHARGNDCCASSMLESEGAGSRRRALSDCSPRAATATVVHSSKTSSLVSR